MSDFFTSLYYSLVEKGGGEENKQHKIETIVSGSKENKVGQERPHRKAKREGSHPRLHANRCRSIGSATHYSEPPPPYPPRVGADASVMNVLCSGKSRGIPGNGKHEMNEGM